MLQIVSPWWMAVLSTVLAHVVMWLAALAGASALLGLQLRRGPRTAFLTGAVWLGANLTVQAIKHGLVPLAPGVGASQLSGHTAVASGAALALTLAVPVRLRRMTALTTAIIVGLVGLGVVVVGWHTPAQATVPVILTGAWAALLRPWSMKTDRGALRAAGPVEATPQDGGSQVGG